MWATYPLTLAVTALLNCNLPSYILHSHFCFRGHFFFLITLKYQCKTLSITESKVLHFLYMSFIKGRRHLMIFIFLAIYHNMMYTVCPILFLPFHPCYQKANLGLGEFKTIFLITGLFGKSLYHKILPVQIIDKFASVEGQIRGRDNPVYKSDFNSLWKYSKIANFGCLFL